MPSYSDNYYRIQVAEEEKPMKRAEEKQIMKKLYVSPKLVEYGSVVKLTQGTLTVGDESGGGMKNSPCL